MNKYIMNELYPIVEKNLSNKDNVLFLKQSVSEYLDRNHEKLTTIGPVHKLTFLEYDKEKVYKAIGLTAEEISQVLKKSPDVKEHGKILQNQFNTAISLAITYFTKKEDSEMVDICLVYLALSFYSSIFIKFFKFEPNENIMNYTINNLSNKFKVKQLGTIYAAIVESVKGAYRHHKQKLINPSDKEIVAFVLDVKARLNSLMRKISVEFYKNHQNSMYLNTEQDNFDEENYRESDSNSYAVERVTNTVVLKLIVDGPDTKVINTAAKFCQVSVNELRNYVNTILTNENREKIRELTESILFLYLFDSQNTVRDIKYNNKFLLYCLEMYKKSNTSDKNIIRIKKILDGWLEDLGTYKKTQRLATINNFRRALFLFFVISIQTLAN